MGMNKCGRMTSWSEPTSFDEVCRRAGGRRRYNAWRRDMATLRRWECAELMAQGYNTTEIAAALGVSPRTVRRYRRQLLAEAAQTGTCPICGARVIMGVGGENPYSAMPHDGPASAVRRDAEKRIFGRKYAKMRGNAKIGA